MGVPRVSPDAAKMRRHRLWILSGAVVAIVVTMGLFVNGAGYYIKPQAERILSPRHGHLKPGGTVGIGLGIAGTALLLLIYLYPLRKRWKWLSKKGKTKRWLDYHILMGLAAPAIITLHSAFKFHGVAGMAYWSMMAVVISGIVGRYLYNKIPRRLGEAELSLDEAEKMRAALAAQIAEQNVLTREELEPLLALPAREEVQRMPLLKALAVIIALDARRAWLIWRVRRHAGRHVKNSAELRQAIALARRQAALSKDVLFLARIKQIFRMWHVVHRPFSYSLAVLAAMHILVVIFLGYF